MRRFSKKKCPLCKGFRFGEDNIKIPTIREFLKIYTLKSIKSIEGLVKILNIYKRLHNNNPPKMNIKKFYNQIRNIPAVENTSTIHGLKIMSPVTYVYVYSQYYPNTIVSDEDFWIAIETLDSNLSYRKAQEIYEKLGKYMTPPSKGIFTW